MEVLIISKSFIVKEALSTLFRSIFEPSGIKVISELKEIENSELEKYSFIFSEISLKNIEELEYICKNRNKDESTRVMALDLSSNEKMFVKSVKNGIDGYITNICDKEEFIFIVKNICAGKKYYDSNLIQNAINHKITIGETSLTLREKEVMMQVSKGHNNREISENLFITEFTVKKHISSIFAKLNLRSRQDIIIYVKDNYECS